MPPDRNGTRLQGHYALYCVDSCDFLLSHAWTPKSATQAGRPLDSCASSGCMAGRLWTATNEHCPVSPFPTPGQTLQGNGTTAPPTQALHYIRKRSPTLVAGVALRVFLRSRVRRPGCGQRENQPEQHPRLHRLNLMQIITYATVQSILRIPEPRLIQPANFAQRLHNVKLALHSIPAWDPN